ncbi:unnamed protein product [Lampetra planeri]
MTAAGSGVAACSTPRGTVPPAFRGHALAAAGKGKSGNELAAIEHAELRTSQMPRRITRGSCDPEERSWRATLVGLMAAAAAAAAAAVRCSTPQAACSEPAALREAAGVTVAVREDGKRSGGGGGDACGGAGRNSRLSSGSKELRPQRTAARHGVPLPAGARGDSRWRVNIDSCKRALSS